MTREQRQALRESLLAQDFYRSGFTNDERGTGQYIEYWRKEDTVIELYWGKRVPS